MADFGQSRFGDDCHFLIESDCRQIENFPMFLVPGLRQLIVKACPAIVSV
jgi:hypothetical protein